MCSRAFGVALAAALVAGCSLLHYPEVNELREVDLAAGYRFPEGPDEANRTFIALAFSGGGTRAAAFAYGALLQLQRDGLLEEVDAISSVSGGSFTAAYLAVAGSERLEEFESKFLRTNIQARLILQLAKPWHWVRLASPYFSRSDLASEYYDQRLFDGATFESLTRRPFLIVNATDLESGARFPFTQEQMDLVCGMLDPVHVARAVTASAAFPGLLSPVTLRNRGGACGDEPPWITNGLGPENLDERRQRARDSRRYRAPGRPEYVHLVDGGVADNLGVRAYIPALSSLDPDLSFLRLINFRQVERLVFIVVDAKSDPDTKIGRHKRAPGIAGAIYRSATLPIDRLSSASVGELDALNRELTGAVRQLVHVGRRAEDLPADVIHVSFDDVEDEHTRHRLKNLGTNFSLCDDDVDLLIDTAGRLLTRNPRYEALLAER